MIGYLHGLWSQMSHTFFPKKLSTYVSDEAAIPLARYFTTPVAQGAQFVVNNARQNPYTALLTAGLLVAGAGLFYVLRERSKPRTKLQMLIQALKDFNVKQNDQQYKAQARAHITQLIEQMDANELNQADKSGTTSLYCALKCSREISSLIIDKFLANSLSVNTTMPDGKSIFTQDKLAQRLLSVVSGQYKTFACSDAKRFPGNIHTKANKQEIMARQGKASGIRAAVEATTIQAYQGTYTRKAIGRCAELVDKSKVGACTTFALAVADKLLKLFPHERIEILGHDGGWRGSHIYVVMNHKGEGWKLNEVARVFEDASVPEGEKAQLLDDAAKELDHTFVIDPWLASLGWQDGVFTVPDYFAHKQNAHFLLGVKCFFDSENQSVENKLSI